MWNKLIFWFPAQRLPLKLSSHSAALRYSTAWQADDQEDRDGALRNQWISTNAWNLLFKRPIISSFSNLWSWNFCSAFLTTLSSSIEKTSSMPSSDVLPWLQFHVWFPIFSCPSVAKFYLCYLAFPKTVWNTSASLSVLLIAVMSHIIPQASFYLFAFQCG